MHCINHPDVGASLVPWWPETHFLDVECGICDECAQGDCANFLLLEVDSDEFWEAFNDMQAHSW